MPVNTVEVTVEQQREIDTLHMPNHEMMQRHERQNLILLQTQRHMIHLDLHAPVPHPHEFIEIPVALQLLIFVKPRSHGNRAFETCIQPILHDPLFLARIKIRLFRRPTKRNVGKHARRSKIVGRRTRDAPAVRQKRRFVAHSNRKRFPNSDDKRHENDPKERFKRRNAYSGIARMRRSVSHDGRD